ncbi:hypothetical protein GQ53DRAFT_838078, partial [Thozetella sp. PMI_491]
MRSLYWPGSLAWLLFDVAIATPPACPTCYTITRVVVPPCLPPMCTGPSAPLDTACSVTIPAEITITTTMPGLNPGCPTTPTAFSYIGCPSAPPCNQQACRLVTDEAGTVVGTACSNIQCQTVTQGTRTVFVTESGLPLKCRPTLNTETTSTTSKTPTTSPPSPPSPPPPPTLSP